jgi:FkbM family methyltransferase
MMPLNRKIYDNLVPNGYRFDCVFDVGANVGQTVRRITDAFDEAIVYAFEPIPDTFAELKTNIAKLPTHCNVQTFNVACGDKTMTERVYLKGLHSQNSLTPNVNRPQSPDARTVDVSVIRLADFVEQKKIKHIDILKLDVEGYELPALRGTSALLQDRVSFVIAEVNFTESDPRQSYFVNVERFLNAYGFRPVGVYDVHYRETDGRLDYCDAVFWNSHAIARKAAAKS